MLYTIYKGHHYNNKWIFPIVFKKTIQGYCKFIEWNYKINKMYDTHKITGISDGWHHRKDSIRLGWRKYKTAINQEDIIELMAIVYNNGVRTISSIKIINTNRVFKYKVEINKNSYSIVIDGEIYSYLRTSKWKGLRYRLLPYFGGKEKAPQNIKIKLV